MQNLLETIQIKSAVREIAKGKVNFDTRGAHIEETVLYARKSVSGLTGIQQLMKPADKQKDGVRNIDSARLAAGEAFLVTGIVISSATAREKLADESAFSSLEFTQGLTEALPSSFFNSELTVNVGNKEKFKSILRHSMQANTTDDTFVKSAHQITPFLIEPQQSIDFSLNIFDPACPPVSDAVVEITLVGYKISANNA